MKYARLFLALLVALSFGCVTPTARPITEVASAADCRDLLAAIDNVISTRGVQDAQATPVPGFPYLRTNRFLSSFRLHVQDAAAFEAWSAQLRAMDRTARNIELLNLPAADRAAIANAWSPAESLSAVMNRCAERLYQAELHAPDMRETLTKNARVPDEYKTSWRVLGLYPVTALFVAGGVSKYQAETHHTFTRPLATLPVRGQLKRYVPPTAAALNDTELRRVLASSASNRLGIPYMDAAVEAKLLARFAPIFEIDVATRDDEIGRPQWGDNVPAVDTGTPTTYTALSYTRFGASTLLQLNYVIWFPARPKSGAFDILGGNMDGVHWRVTLDTDGRVLLYDVMHNCGCYHMYFPSVRLAARADAGTFEPPLIPQSAPAAGISDRIVVRLASTTHYVQRAYTATESPGQPYRFASYDALRSIEIGNETRRSLFDANGIVEGTARAERWVLWPMGVPAPGAMRQLGHHAVAFVGRRHFDDADLLEQVFQLKEPPQ